MTTLETVRDLKPEWPVPSDTDRDIWAGSAQEAESSSTPESTAGASGAEKTALDKVATAVTVEELENPLNVLGSTHIYDESGKIRLIPTPPPDPKDPLNMPNWRKYVAIGSLCFFGSISLCADLVIAGLLPVFLLEYSGVDPKTVLKQPNVMKGNPSPLSLIPKGVVPVSLYEVTLLSTLPPLSNCVASYLLVPLSLAIGRRPVLLVMAMCSWIGGFWAGFSTSLRTHLLARLLHGLGSATAEGLLPLIMQDMVFIHQRNRAIAAIMVLQGPLMTVFGIISPYVAVNYSWRWLYWITSGVGILAWIMIIIFVPETRKLRSKQELSGQVLWPIEPGKNRTELDYETYGKRTWRDDLGFFRFGFEWKETGIQMLRTLQSTYFPAVLMVIGMDAIFFIMLHSVGQTISFALLAAGIPYELSGLHVITQVLSSAVVYIFGGPVADKLTLKISRVRGDRGREPEYQLPNLVVPVVSAMIGCIVFGVAQHYHLHVAVLLTGTFFMGVGTMTSFTILKTFIIESYPHWPGPVLVNVTTFRTLLSFAFSSHATVWVQERGPLVVFGIYMAVLFIMSLNIPIFYFYGKRFRLWTSGRVAKLDARATEIDARAEALVAQSRAKRAGSGDAAAPASSSVLAGGAGAAAASDDEKMEIIETIETVPDKSATKVTSRETVSSGDSHHRGGSH